MTESVSDTVLAFDFGLRRIGVAVGNRLTGGAQPLTVVSGENDVRRFEIITRLIAEWHPQRLVVGHPRHPDGTPHAMTARCERFARQLQGRYRLPVALVDERYSSVDAQSGLREQQRAGSRRRGAAVRGAGGSDPLLDAEAAAVILRQYWSEAAVAAPSFSQP